LVRFVVRAVLSVAVVVAMSDDAIKAALREAARAAAEIPGHPNRGGAAAAVAAFLRAPDINMELMLSGADGIAAAVERAAREAADGR
jgi:hypothetical protein